MSTDAKGVASNAPLAVADPRYRPCAIQPYSPRRRLHLLGEADTRRYVGTMNRAEADRALGIIRTVIQNTREDLVAHNWGLIWIIHSFINLAACVAGWIIESQDGTLFWYLVPLAVTAVLNISVVLVLVTRDRGVRSHVEWQIHGIWITFIIFTLAGAGALQLSGASPKLFGSIFAMTSGIGFAMMAVVFARQLPYAIVMLVLTLVGPLMPGWQWLFIGVTWWCALFFTGLGMHRENQRRLQDGSGTKLL
jgi:hypothetical protein